jgi:hypothetical protein
MNQEVRPMTTSLMFTCDCCGVFMEGTGDCGAVWEPAKEAGWRAFREDNAWLHRCPDCAGADRAVRAETRRAAKAEQKPPVDPRYAEILAQATAPDLLN